MDTLDAGIILGFIAYAVVTGLRARNIAGESLEEYFLAGRSLPGWKAGISMAATQFAADTPLMVTGLIATAGIFSLWRLWIYALAFLLLGFVLASSWRRAGVITDAELTELRYGGQQATVLRAIKAIYFGTIFNCMVLGFVLLAATRIAEPFLLWDTWTWFPTTIHEAFVSLARWIGTNPEGLSPLSVATGPDLWGKAANNLISIVAILLVTAFYSTTGGLRSVVNTDVLQFAVMMLGTLLFTVAVVDQVGGLAALPEEIRARFAAGGPGGIQPAQILAFTPGTARDASPAVLVLFAVQWFAQMNADGTGYLAQRSMACRSDRDAKLAALWFTCAQVLVRSLLWLPLGLSLLLLFPPDLSLGAEQMRIDRELSFVRGLAALPSGTKGLMVTAMLAALASTIDTHLNWGSSYWTNDIYKRLICQAWRKTEPSRRSLVWVARMANIAILLLGLVVMTQLGSIGAAWEKSLLVGAGMGGVLLLRWVWWRLTASGELSAILASLLLLPLLHVTVDGSTKDGAAMQLILMFAGSTACGVAASLAGGPEDMRKLQRFYERARPPGFWGPVAAGIGKSPAAARRRLWRGLAAVTLAALSVFCLLTAVGSWLVGSPPPSWFPARGLWLTLLGTIAIALTPLWWRLAFAEPVDS